MTGHPVKRRQRAAVLLAPPWLGHNARVVILARALRTFGYGCTSVLLAGMLSADGVPTAGIGLLLAVAALGSVTASLAMGVFADRFGRRFSLLLTAGLMGIAGVLFTCSESYPVLLFAAFIGTISPSTNDNSPFSGVEQAILAQACPSRHHTAVFARYSMTALLAGAAGALGAAALGLLSAVEPGDAAFAVYTALSVVIMFLFWRLTPAAERDAEPPHPPDPSRPEGAGRRPSRVVCKLAGLFAIDAFAGGLAVQAVLALWFQHRFGVSDTQLGILFFGANLLPALSQALAPGLVSRYGLLGTMLIPHAVSNLLLLCVPWAPTFGLATGALWTRQALSKIDVPARQAFTAAIVTPAERTAAASLTTVARSVAVSASPLTSSLMLVGPLMASGAPFLLGGGLALAYDVTMWRSFRHAAAANVPTGRHRRRAGAAPATTPDPALEDTIPTGGQLDPVQRVHTARWLATEATIPIGPTGWSSTHRPVGHRTVTSALPAGSPRQLTRNPRPTGMPDVHGEQNQ